VYSILPEPNCDVLCGYHQQTGDTNRVDDGADGIVINLVCIVSLSAIAALTEPSLAAGLGPDSMGGGR